MRFAWPDAFPRIPDEEWTRARVEDLAEKYDTVERHGWYANLDPTLEELEGLLAKGGLLVDYSGGTGILIARLLERVGEAPVGIVNVDSSPKFLALSLAKFRREPRVAFRLLRYRKEEKRLDALDEALAPLLGERPADVLVSTNAIHLYTDLDATLHAWRRSLRPGGRALVQSGNVRGASGDAWIIDDTVEAVHHAARRLVAEDPRFARHKPMLEDPGRLAAHDAFRRRVFPPPRDVEAYRAAFASAGLRVLGVRTRAIRVRVDEWEAFLGVYADAILGFVGGNEKVDGRRASSEDAADRLRLLRAAMGVVFHGKDAFDARWTYFTCEAT